eukprot:917490-Alexandrium_andersonii.AAC.1
MPVPKVLFGPVEVLALAGLPMACRRRRTRPCRASESLQAIRVPGGYNCRGFLWIGEARTEAVWDTGSTRNSVSKEYLETLLGNSLASGAVTDVYDIEPLHCTSVKKGLAL